MKLQLATLLFAAVSSAGCSQSPQPALSPATPASQAPMATAGNQVPAAAANPDCEFCAVPAIVKRCEVRHGVRTTLFWNVESKGVKQVVVYVVDKNGIDKHFGVGPAKGSKLTGPWLQPGIQFKIKDMQGKELDVLTIDGVPC